MFPIRNEVGDAIAFSGRQLKDDPRSGKYINSTETDIFKKSNVLFALDRSKKAILKEKAVILCEGQIDAIACHEGGVENAIAPLGTAFTAQHARILKRYAQTAVLCFDADNAGVKACERAFRELAPEGLSVKVVELPAGDDPDTYLKAHGVEGFRRQVAEARDFFDFKISSSRKNGRMETAEGRTELTRECTELLAAMGDHAARDQQINIVATMLGLGSATLREGISNAVRKANAQAQRPVRGQQEEQTAVAEPIPLDRTVGYLCHLALTSAPAQHFLSEQFETLHEAKQWVEGIALLEKILAASPDTTSNAAVNAFVAGLRKSEQLALHKEMGATSAASEDGIQAAEQTLGMLSSIVLQKRDSAVKAALQDPGLSPERMRELLEEAKEIAGLLRWTGRSAFNDELAPETKKAEKKPWEKWKK
jgi:DNA primase